MSSRPARAASSTTYWIAGLSTTGSISFGVALVAGRNRVPRPAAGMTAFLTRWLMPTTLTRPGLTGLRHHGVRRHPPSVTPAGLGGVEGFIGRAHDGRGSVPVRREDRDARRE